MSNIILCEKVVLVLFIPYALHILRVFANNHPMMDLLPVVVCIGTRKVSGDALGPLVGDRLAERLKGVAHVYGTSAMPVNGVNLEEYLELIECLHGRSLVVAVDAAVGRVEDVGKIRVRLGGVKAGGALKKKLPWVGHIGVTGIVTERGEDNLGNLMAVPPEYVRDLSEVVAKRVEQLIGNFADAAATEEEFAEG